MIGVITMNSPRPILLALVGMAVLSSGLPTVLAQEAKDWQPTLRDSVAKIELQDLGASSPLLQREPEPLIRFDNKVGVVIDGVVFAWTDGGRPRAFAQVFLMTNGWVLHEFQSTSTRPMVLKDAGVVKWKPGQPGIEWQTPAMTPAPAPTRAARLAQMRLIARRYLVKEDFRTGADNSKTERFELRLLPNPVYRYPEQAVGPSDGAVFAHVLGTDPEVLMLIEAELNATKPVWRVAFAPLTCFACQTFEGAQQVWSVEERMHKSKESDPYHIWGHHQEFQGE